MCAQAGIFNVLHAVPARSNPLGPHLLSPCTVHRQGPA